jgi:hypothetical protein
LFGQEVPDRLRISRFRQVDVELGFESTPHVFGAAVGRQGDKANRGAQGGTQLPGHLVANAAFLSQNFSSQSFGIGAAPDGRQGHQSWNPQTLADALFIKNLLDGHSKTRSGSYADFGPPPNRIADMLALRRADATARSLADGAASVLGVHKRIDGLDAFFADSRN